MIIYDDYHDHDDNHHKYDNDHHKMMMTILTPAVEPLLCLAEAQTPREPVKTSVKPPGDDDDGDDDDDDCYDHEYHDHHIHDHYYSDDMILMMVIISRAFSS